MSDTIIRDYVGGRLQTDLNRVIADLASCDPQLRARIAAVQGDTPERAMYPKKTTVAAQLRPLPFSSLIVMSCLAAVLLVGLLFQWGGARPDPKAALIDKPAFGIFNGAVDGSSGLYRALEQSPDGTKVAARDGHAKSVATFRDVRGLYCREFDISFANNSTGFSGFACRSTNARWIVELVVPDAHSPTASYLPASTVGADLLAQTIAALTREPSIGADHVNRLLKAKWRAS